MTSLFELTPELVEATLSFVDRPELLNLCLTCRAVLPLARRRLFRHVTLRNHKDSKGRPIILDILGALHRQPDLALCVQRLELFGDKPDPLWDMPTTDEIFPRAYYHASEDEKILIQPLESQSDKAYIDFIAQLHNLRFLKLGLTFSALALKFDNRFHHLNSIVLEECRYDSHDRFALRSIDPYLFQELCRLPSITHLDLKTPGTQLSPIHFDGLLDMPFLSSLVLRWSVIDTEDLTKLLAKTPNLKKFHLGFFVDTTELDIRRKISILDLDQVSYALSQISETLKDLSISINWFQEQGAGPDIEGVHSRALTWGKGWSRGRGTRPQLKDSHRRALTFGPRGSLNTLAQFRCLEHLDIALVALLGFWPAASLSLATVLPSSLRYLYLSDDLAEWLVYQWDRQLLLRTLRDLLRGRWKILPLLERVVLRFECLYPAHDQGPDFWAKEDLNFPKEFYATCKLAGIHGMIDLQRLERYLKKIRPSNDTRGYAQNWAYSTDRHLAGQAS